MATEILTLPAGSEPHVLPAEDGAYAEVLDFHYHQWEACSQSRLKTMEEKTPAHLKASMDTPESHGTQKQENLDRGAGFHMAVLQPDEFEKWFKPRPDGHPNSNAYKAARDQMLAENPYLRILKQDSLDTIRWARDAVLAHPAASALLDLQTPELSAVWTDPDTGLRCKGRFDDVSAGMGLVDLKLTRDASPEGFGKIAYDMRYYRQGAFYLTGKEALGLDVPNEFFFVCVEPEPPFAVAVYRTPASWLVKGEAELDHLLPLYAWCVESGEWPAYSEAVEYVVFPPWADKDAEIRYEDLEEVA